MYGDVCSNLLWTPILAALLEPGWKKPTDSENAAYNTPQLVYGLGLGSAKCLWEDRLGSAVKPVDLPLNRLSRLLSRHHPAPP
jgi:hypothetical protein